MHIGSLKLDSPTILAPLAGITNLPFRLMAKEAGCGMVCSEMISANGLVRHSEKTFRMLDSHPDEKPLSVQLFGADPGALGEAAALVESLGADVLDINFGCPVKKVIKTGAGAALMKSPEQAKKIILAVRDAVKIPLTIKIRSGWDPSGDQARETARIAEGCGVDALTVHPRTVAQGFSGKADWSIIGAIKKTVSIPVIGNGDITRAQDAVEIQRTTGCDAVMIGRAAIGNPWIFTQVNQAFAGRNHPPVDLAARLSGMEKFIRLSVRHLGEKRACRMMRSRLGWFVKGLPFSSRFRESTKAIATETEALEVLSEYGEALRQFFGCCHQP